MSSLNFPTVLLFWCLWCLLGYCAGEISGLEVATVTVGDSEIGGLESGDETEVEIEMSAKAISSTTIILGNISAGNFASESEGSLYTIKGDLDVESEGDADQLVCHDWKEDPGEVANDVNYRKLVDFIETDEYTYNITRYEHIQTKRILCYGTNSWNCIAEMHCPYDKCNPIAGDLKSINHYVTSCRHTEGLRKNKFRLGPLKTWTTWIKGGTSGKIQRCPGTSWSYNMNALSGGEMCVTCKAGTYPATTKVKAEWNFPLDTVNQYGLKVNPVHQHYLGCFTCPSGRYNNNPPYKMIGDNWMPYDNRPDLVCKQCPEGKITYTHTTYSKPPASVSMYRKDRADLKEWISDKIKGKTTCSACGAGRHANEERSRCVDCPVGKVQKGGKCTTCQNGYTGNDMGLECIKCAPGKYSVGGSGCLDCPTGKYNGDFGKSFCFWCSGGKYGIGTGGTSSAAHCHSCAKGKYSSSDHKTCVDCPAGKYGPREGSSYCLSCPMGKVSKTTGETELSTCTECTLGKYTSSDRSYCKACPLGKFSKPGASRCQDCGAGTYGSFWSRTHTYYCANCIKNTYNPNTGSTSSSACLACPDKQLAPPGSSACSFCPGGKYFHEEVLNRYFSKFTCESCPKGKYGAESVCTPCAAGKYAAAAEAASCDRCDGGKSTNSATGATSCSGCAAGRSAGAGDSSCTICAKGRYSTAASATCTKCNAGKISTVDGATTCTSCAVGKTSPEGAKACVSCARGRYNSQYTKGYCYQCPYGKSSNLGATSCFTCGPGKYSKGHASCIPCSAGKYNSKDGNQTPSNSRLPGCASCATGKVQASTGASACSACEAGKFADKTGLSTCKTCAAGKFASGTGKSSCSNCYKGNKCPDTGMTAMIQCTSNSISNSFGSTKCEACATGKLANAKLYYYPRGVKHWPRTYCITCSAGRYNDGGDECTLCDEGKIAANTASGKCTACEAGKYANNYRTSCLDCARGRAGSDGKACTKCANGKFSTGGAAECDTCSAGKYTNRPGMSGCSNCGKGQTSTPSFSGCVSCTAG